SIPFCFSLDGGYRQYTRVGHEILNADAGNHLMPIPENLSYAGSALVEPWACVEATYRIQYRSHIQCGGRMLVLGANSRNGMTTGNFLRGNFKPAEVVVSSIPVDLYQEIQELCRQSDISFQETSSETVLQSDLQFDDVFLLDDAIRLLKDINALLAKNAVVALCQQSPSSRMADVDLGRIHYDAVQYTGTDSLDLSEAYSYLPTRSALKSRGRTLILGAGGPMGRMNLQRAIQTPDGPVEILASECNPNRLNQLEITFKSMAEQEGVILSPVNPGDKTGWYEEEMQRILSLGGFDDIRLMAVSPELLQNILPYCANHGIVDIFAGLKRGTTAAIPADLICGPSQVRLIGHSGLKHADEQAVLQKSTDRTLTLEQSVAAIGGLLQIPEAIEALENSTFPGKILIYPHVRSFPLTGLPGLKDTAAEVYAALGKAETWTQQAERVFLDMYLDG
ncbi:MAG: hypothetical protein JXA25_06850, partial [Anaerolineales bacterium]|nr:hypothetical protein [Anaerolineales bacterium]